MNTKLTKITQQGRLSSSLSRKGLTSFLVLMVFLFSVTAQDCVFAFHQETFRAPSTRKVEQFVERIISHFAEDNAKDANSQRDDMLPNVALAKSIGPPKLSEDSQRRMQRFLDDFVEGVLRMRISYPGFFLSDLWDELFEKHSDIPQELFVLTLGPGGRFEVEWPLLRRNVFQVSAVGITRGRGVTEEKVRRGGAEKGSEKSEWDKYQKNIGEMREYPNFTHHDELYDAYLGRHIQTYGGENIYLVITAGGLELDATIARGAMPCQELIETYAQLYDALGPGGVILNLAIGGRGYASAVDEELRSELEAMGFEVIQYTNEEESLFNTIIRKKPSHFAELDEGKGVGEELVTEAERDGEDLGLHPARLIEAANESVVRSPWFVQPWEEGSLRRAEDAYLIVCEQFYDARVREFGIVMNALKTIRALNPKKVLVVGNAIPHLPVGLAVMGVDLVFIDLDEEFISEVRGHMLKCKDFIPISPKLFTANIDSIDQIEDKNLQADIFDVVLLLDLVGGHERFQGDIAKAVANSYHVTKSDGIMYLYNEGVDMLDPSTNMGNMLLKMHPTCSECHDMPSIRTLRSVYERLTGYHRVNYPYRITKPPDKKAHFAETTIPIEAVYKEGRTNIVLVEELLSTEATEMFRKQTGITDLRIRIRFFGAGKYLCGDDGWHSNTFSGDYDLTVMPSVPLPCLPAEQRNLYSEMSDEAFKSVVNRIIGPDGKPALLDNILKKFKLGWASKQGQDLLIENVDITRAAVNSLHEETMHPKDSETNWIVIKRYLNLLYYLGDREIYEKYRKEFFETFPRGYVEKIDKPGLIYSLACRMREDNYIQQLIKDLNDPLKETEMADRFDKNAPWILGEAHEGFSVGPSHFAEELRNSLKSLEAAGRDG